MTAFSRLKYVFGHCLLVAHRKKEHKHTHRVHSLVIISYLFSLTRMHQKGLHRHIVLCSVVCSMSIFHAYSIKIYFYVGCSKIFLPFLLNHTSPKTEIKVQFTQIIANKLSSQYGRGTYETRSNPLISLGISQLWLTSKPQ